MEDHVAKFSTLEISEKIQEALPDNKTIQLVLEAPALRFNELASGYDQISVYDLADLVVAIQEPIIDLTKQPELPIDMVLFTQKDDQEDVAVAVRSETDTDVWFANATSQSWSELIEDYEPEYYNYNFIVRP